MERFQGGSPIESLFVSLGFVIDTKQLDEFSKKIAEMKTVATSVGVVTTAALAGIGVLVKGTADKLDEIGDFADLHDMTGQAVMAYQKIAKEHDSSAQAALSSLAGISEKVGEAALGIGRGAILFEKMGLSARDASGEVKGVDAVLDELADRMARMSAPERMAFAHKMGIDSTFVNVLKDGTQALRSMREAALSVIPFTDEDFKMAGEAHLLFLKAGGAATVLKDQIALGLMPAVNDALQAFTDWVKAARQAAGRTLTNAFKLMGLAVATVGSVAVTAARSVADLGKTILGASSALAPLLALVAAVLSYKVGAWAIGAASALVKFAAAVKELGIAGAIAAPLPLLLGAAIIILIAAIEDFMAYKKGKKSIIGELTDEFKEFKVAADGLVKTWEAIKSAFSGEGIKPRFEPNPGAGRWEPSKGGSIVPQFNPNGGMPAWMSSWFGGAKPAASNTSTTTVNINAPITVTSPDPQAAGYSVRDELRREARGAIRNTQTPVVQ